MKTTPQATSLPANATRGIPRRVVVGLAHVRTFFPKVEIVVYDRDFRWHYFDADFNAPSFKGKPVDIGLLEDAADGVVTAPAVYQLNLPR